MQKLKNRMKVITAKRLLKKVFITRKLNEPWPQIIGEVPKSFIMLVWGQSSSGKSSFVTTLTKELAHTDRVLYVALEEGAGLSTQKKTVRNELGETTKNVWYTEHNISLADLRDFLSKKKTAIVVVIDSLQYFNITYSDYKKLKEDFPRHTFIFISHAKGKLPDNKTADKIRYDAGIKVRVDGHIAFVQSRYGGGKNFVVWEKAAKEHWGAKMFKKLSK